MNHIELFAGCGGLSLGLESTGFKLLLANELSPMAGETFAYNFFGQNLKQLALDDTAIDPSNSPTKWLSSQFGMHEMARRLREDPRQYPPLGKGKCDISDPAQLQGNLVIGSIVQLNEWLARNDDALTIIKNGFGDGGVDLVSGGPPCQSFSMAGMRQYNNSRNVLPMEFANFVGMVKPRMALLENVTGILRPFNVDGKKIHAWFEVAKAFVATGYVPLCLHVNAKLAGVAQNRPRFLMILFHRPVFEALLPSLNEYERDLMLPSMAFYEHATKDPLVEYSAGMLRYFDVSSKEDLLMFKNSFLQPLVAFDTKEKQFTVHHAIDDLRKNGSPRSAYWHEIDTLLSPHVADHPMENHDPRQNSPRVQRRFRIYQIIQQAPKTVQNEVQRVLSGDEFEISDESFGYLHAFWFLGHDGKRKKFGKADRPLLTEYLREHRTKKQTQKALDIDVPAPAALSIPDDACHYHCDELRTLTVREMARIQSFPDRFAFRSKVTTGGQMRKFEVPQYTQVGNAVPPLLGRALGLVFQELLGRLRTRPAPKTKRKSEQSGDIYA